MSFPSPSGSDVGIDIREDLRSPHFKYRMNTYLFIYYLIQFCGHSWIFTNMMVRLFSFGKDSLVDTFYAIGLVMRLCQSLSLLELLHLYVGIEPNRLFPRFLQLTERIIILFVVITSQDEVQGKYVVCVLFFFWNLLDVVRYTYSMLSVIEIHYPILTWLRHTLWMLIYPLCVLAEEAKIPYYPRGKEDHGSHTGAGDVQLYLWCVLFPRLFEEMKLLASLQDGTSLRKNCGHLPLTLTPGSGQRNLPKTLHKASQNTSNA
ncbi:very-long-chain (3R)-3-hydroxyacyl-CoA dehydratase 4 isoform X3 [Ornithorhynchus anatinus]|uniref:very-long-chain (3R)-3-hydroxyacyl-CoA dehydratase 4 isoform X3 n=1 Tax=Ornithorhynchus anatinus TaxID=9258 RepID=UPI0019D455E3|nr:very-long-chain (3R)-3-hydroxyacyl-CoA dehydratase 4 isoform X3 [Ornithorhynchus anatinus]